jgi:arylsulfatase A-like enzyme
VVPLRSLSAAGETCSQNRTPSEWSQIEEVAMAVQKESTDRPHRHLWMSRPLQTIATLVFAAICFCHAASHVLAEEPASKLGKPNVVMIYADDFGWGDLSCYGHPYARTPNLDRLAQQGTRFQQCYSTGVTCCPARTGLMTSKFPATYPVYPANGGFANRVTVTELLKKQGYHTGHFGKWHIGPHATSGTYGIDSVGADDKQRARQDPRGRDAQIFDDAARFIEQHKAGPFYVNVWGHISHHPISPPDSYVARFQNVVIDEAKFAAPIREKFDNCKQRGGDVNDHLRRYMADVFSMDEDVGRLLQRIDDLGLRDNTIVVFSSDQGPAPLTLEPKERKKGKNASEDLRLNAMGYTGELRGGKHGMYEGGVRVPFIIRWPGHVPAGRVDETSVISGIDWLPTLCTLADIRLNAADFDGEDVSAAWLGKLHTRTRPLLWKTSNPKSELAIRSGPWKLHYPNRKRGELELFNISTDPGETKNLVAQHPEIVQALSTQIERWNATLPKDYIKSDDKTD